MFRFPARERQKRRLILPMIILLLVGFVVFLGVLGSRGVQGLKIDRFQPFSFLNRERINAVFCGPPLSFLSLNLAEKTAVKVIFPDDLYFPETAFGYGQLPSKAVYRIGSLDRRGGETLAGTVQDYLGVPVEGFFCTRLPDGGKDLFSLLKLLAGGETNLGIITRWRLVTVLWNLRPDKIVTLDLGELAEVLVLADGSQARAVEARERDRALSGRFREEKAAAENWRVAVVNTTDINGLGARAGRLLANLGLSVVEVTDRQEVLPRCRVGAAKKEALNSLTARRIRDIYGCTLGEGAAGGRGDITLFLSKL